MTATPPLVVTGAGGFVGRALLERPGISRFPSVTALSRSVPGESDGRVRRIHFDLRDRASVPELPRGCVILHLAAATGAAPARVHQELNVGGTARVIELARASGAGLVHVSTIAVRYPDDPRYPYARAKRRGEELVAGSGVPHAIARPTVVLGPDGPTWSRLRSMGTGRVRLTIGDGSARLQPIHVNDLADLLLELAASGPLEGQAWELGGPEVTTVGDFLATLRRVAGLPPAPLVRIPHALLRPALVAAELLLGDRVPVRAGQVTALVRDSVSSPNALWEASRLRMMGIEPMLRRLLGG